MALMSCSMQCESCRRCISSALFVLPMDLSTKTSMIFTCFEGMDGCRDCGIMIVSNSCQGSDFFPFTNSDMMPLAVSDPAQKKGGYLHHPICSSVGTTSSASSSDTGQPSATERA